MALTRYKLGDLIEESFRKNTDLKYDVSYVRGISNNKQIMETKADVDESVIYKFYIVNPGEFIYNPRTTRMGDKIGLGYNNTSSPLLFSFNNIAFYIKESAKKLILPEYLYMFFNRTEFDRYAMTNGWGSATELFSMEEMYDVDIDLPPLSIQQKYVDVYNSMLANQKSYERGLEDLKLTCDAYIEDLRRKYPCEEIGPYIEEQNETNENNKITLFQGVNVDHIFTEPKRVAEDSDNGSVVRTGQFAFNKVMKAHNTKLPIALREDPDCVVSNSYTVFKIIDETKILPKYLLLWFNRAETQRYAGFISFGTTRDIFSFDDMKQISIPLPDIKIQQCIVDIFNSYQARNEINENLKSQIKSICPILIKGSIEEAMREA